MRIAPFIIAVALLASALPAAAQEWYAVEVIVFQHRGDASAQDELWPPDPGHPDLSRATPVLPPTDPRTLRPFEQLGPTELQMGGAWRTLSESSRYQPLVHVGWRQPGLDPEAMVPVRIDLASGERLPAEPLVLDDPLAVDNPSAIDEADPYADPEASEALPVDEPPALTNPWLIAERLRAEYPAEPVPEPLLGTVTLRLQRFLHVDVDLLLTTDEPLPLAEGERDWLHERENILADLTFELIGADEARARLEALNARPRMQAYRLQAQRRVRTTELHYFDHPKFGVIATVRPIPAEEIDALRAATPPEPTTPDPEPAPAP